MKTTKQQDALISGGSTSNLSGRLGGADLISNLVLQKDISRLDEKQRVEYYTRLCDSLGLNPFTQPFQIIRFEGREKLYATKDCTEQLRKIHGVSVTDIAAVELKGVYVVTAKAIDKNGKTDAATGVVAIESMRGNALANALMKAETKAKRRVTLSICGLGLLDESEIETLPGVIIDTLKVSTSEKSIDEAIGKLGSCTNVDELTMLKDSLDENVVKHQRFVQAGRKRFQEIENS